MNVLREIKVSSVFRSFNQPCRSLTGSVDKMTDVFILPGQASIKYLNSLDKGNAKANSLFPSPAIVDEDAGAQARVGLLFVDAILYKSYAKLVKAIELHMNSVGGQRVVMPSLYSIDLLKESDRLDALKNELFTLTARNSKEMYLAPTHEEPITSIISSNWPRSRQLPLLLYQIDSKFRNEIRPRFGLLRANQFVMKDAYSFDKDQKSAFRTYDKVCQSYEDLFNYLQLDFVKVIASNGLMGGNFSHEYHLLSKYGEDDIYLCENCKTAYNKETITEEDAEGIQQADPNEIQKCPECKNEMEHKKSIEIGHTFYLGTKYSEKMNALYLDLQWNKEDETEEQTESTRRRPLEMCCFGIGVTRILSAFISQQTDLSEISWPLQIAPYHVLIISPKRGSKQNIDQIGDKMAENISNALKLKGFDVLHDNRSELTIGRRQIDSLAYGFPYKIIIGKESINEIPRFELHSKDQTSHLTHAELLGKFDEISKML